MDSDTRCETVATSAISRRSFLRKTIALVPAVAAVAETAGSEGQRTSEGTEKAGAEHHPNGAAPMPYSDYTCFRFRFDSGVAFVTMDHPPLNLLDEVMSQEFEKLGRELEADGIRYAYRRFGADSEHHVAFRPRPVPSDRSYARSPSLRGTRS